MIRHCDSSDFSAIFQVINDAAQAYRGVIPEDCWPESQNQPYMPQGELREEMESGVQFLGYQEDEELIGVMGSQPVGDVTLIRHAYVRTAHQGRGIGGQLLSDLAAEAVRPLLIGTWADAVWAIRFYLNRGFELVPPEEKDGLLSKYWSVPQRQMDASVVLGDERWFGQQRG